MNPAWKEFEQGLNADEDFKVEVFDKDTFTPDDPLGTGYFKVPTPKSEEMIKIKLNA